jgi:crotonobetainyl-CoA:carnitine CoA-transferase CaiB-like acyl-CoA transferase
VEGIGWVFRTFNSKKQSVAVDLKKQEGKKVVGQLAAHFDVVVEGFRPGVAERLGIDFASLTSRNPRLVYCSISGYGQGGEHRDLPGHDLTYAAMSGLLDALFPEQPRVPGVQMVDTASSLLAAIRILAALHATDHGPQYLDVSLYDAAHALMPLNVAEASLGQTDTPSLLDLLRGGERNDVYPCADGRFVAITPLEEPFWQRLCALLAGLGLIVSGAVPTSDELHAIMRQRASDEWFKLLAKADVPCAPVTPIREVVTSAVIGDAPELGEHTNVWLAELGYSDQEIRALKERGVVRSATGTAYGN